MNYQHLYHAGSFSDIVKHLTLIICLEKLNEKEAPFFVLDTHAAAGKYNLRHLASIRTQEADQGIKKLLAGINSNYLNDNNFVSYLKILAKINLTCPADLIKNKELNFYPGSPYITKYFLRNQDRALFAEIQNDEFIQLKRNFAGNKKISVLNEDGFALIKAKLPPLEKRGLILIDPAFEKDNNRTSDFIQIIDSLRAAKKRFKNGIYIIWYPITNKSDTQKSLADFYQQISNLKFEQISQLTIKIKEDTLKSVNSINKSSMNSCGLIIINALWPIEARLNAALNKIAPIINITEINKIR
jgi:23S rRNA (adenine2030-N6)-methyltransferase